MQTFRAYLRDAAGEITWAAWIDAPDAEAAQARALALCPQGAPSVDLWTPSGRAIGVIGELEPV